MARNAVKVAACLAALVLRMNSAVAEVKMVVPLLWVPVPRKKDVEVCGRPVDPRYPFTGRVWRIGVNKWRYSVHFPPRRPYWTVADRGNSAEGTEDSPEDAKARVEEAVRQWEQDNVP